MRLPAPVIAMAILAGLLPALTACTATSDSTRSRLKYPSTSKTVSVWFDGFSGRGASEMQAYFTDELNASGAFTMALDPSSAGVRLRCQTSQNSQGSSSKGGDFSLGGTRIDLGGSESTWRITFSIQEMGSPTGGFPINMSLSDEVTASGMDVGGRHQGTSGSTSGSLPRADTEEAMRNLANNMCVKLMQALKARGQL